MFTANDANIIKDNDLDERIEKEVRNSLGNSAYLRVYVEDWFSSNIAEELEKRGFKNIMVPYMVLCGDVYFEW